MRALRIGTETIFLMGMMLVVLIGFSGQVHAEQDGPFTYSIIFTQTGIGAEITGYTGAGGDVTIPATLGGVAVKSIGNRAFYNCQSLTGMTIPNGVTTIGDEAFSCCAALAFINIPESMRTINKYVFQCCYSLTNVTIPNGVTTIGENAFDNCTALESMTIPASVTNIGKRAFRVCHTLTYFNVDVDNLNYSSKDGVLYNKEGTILVSFPGALSSIKFPDDVTTIGEYAFDSCLSLTSLSIPNGITTINEGAFFNCASLSNVTIPNSVTAINDSVFSFCTALTDVTIPNSVTSIGQRAFDGSGLINVTIPSSVTTIGYRAFMSCRFTSLTIPYGVVTIDDSAFSSCGSMKSVTISNSVKTIGPQAFAYSWSLASVTIGNSVETIGDGAFIYSQYLETVAIPKSVKSIGVNAFWGSERLKSIQINSRTTEIKEMPYSNSNNYTIPGSTTIIGYDPSTAKSYAHYHGNPFELLENKKKAIYILPGFLGSTLYDTTGTTPQTAWADDTFIEMDAIVYLMNSVLGGPQSRLTRNSDGSGISSELLSVEGLDANGTRGTYSALVDGLKTDSLKDYEVVFFPYNWLGDLNDSEKALENDIKTNGYDKVVFVTHSTGGLLASAYIAASDENKKKVEKAILIAAPLYGTYESYKTIETGKHRMIEEMVVPPIKTAITSFVEKHSPDWLNQNGFGKFAGEVGGDAVVELAKGYIRNALINSPTAYQLFPSNEYLSIHPVEFKDVNYSLETNPINSENQLNPALIKKGTEVISYDRSITELANKFSADGYPLFNSSLIAYGNRSHQTFRENSLKGDVVESLMEVETLLIGSSQSIYLCYTNPDELLKAMTVTGVSYTVNNYGSYLLSDYTYGPGDGTVPADSAFGNRGIPYRPNRLKYMDFKGLDHNQLGSDSDVISHVVAEINGTNTEYGVIGNKTMSAESEAPGMSSLIKYNIQSDQPYDIKIMDENGSVLASVIDGEETGFDDGKYIFEDLSGAEADRIGFLYVPNTGLKVEYYSGTTVDKPLSFIVNVSTLDENGNKTATAIYTSNKTGEGGRIFSFNELSLVVDKTNLGNLVENRSITPVIKLTDWKIPEAIKLVLNESKDMEITGSEADAVRGSLVWTSSDDSVISVSKNGNMTAKGYGFATINVTDGNMVQTSQILVNCSPDSVKLSNLELDVDMRKLVKPVFTPTETNETNLTYHTDNTDIITIDANGVVIPVKEGVATVTGTTDNGLTDTFTVTVKDDHPLIGITFDKTTIDLVKDSVGKLIVVYEPENTTDDKIVTWMSSEESVAKVDNDGNVTGVSEGQAIITAKVGSFTAICTVNVKSQTLLGDVDGNGSITAYDALMALQLATGKKQGSEAEQKAADVDNSGSVQAYDALQILQYATGKIKAF